MSTPTPLIVAARRTPIARLDGDLAGHDAQALAAGVIAAVLADSGLPAEAVDDVILASAAGPGGNLARRAALDAGLPVTVPGLTVDRQCGGGLDAIVLACRLVQAGAGDVYVAGGVESATTSPMRDADGPDRGVRGRRFFPRNMFAGGGEDDPGMAESAEIVAQVWGIARDRQDAFAARSHARAAHAVLNGDLDAEIAACGEVAEDSCPRPTLSAERLARYPSIVRSGGTVTAGNSSQIADGAAVVVVASARAVAAATGLALMDAATAGVAPRVCGVGAAHAARMLSSRNATFVPQGMDQIAMTEAFAAQVLATADELGLDEERLNPRGGAIALGHPWGASGAIQVVRLFHDLAPGRQGLALAAIAGGMGTAAWFRAVAA